MTARRLWLVSTVLAASAVAWALVVAQTRGMPGTGVWPYELLWIAMTVAMMLPPATPMLLLVDRLSRAAVPLFALGYLLIWVGFGLVAYLVGRLVSWNDVGVLLVAIGAYQLLPFRHACLRRCRNPLAFLRAHADHGPLRTGIAHGGVCIGCCAGLMVLLLGVGAMSVAWMGAIAGVILAEKLLPGSERLAVPSAVGLIATGAWIGLA